MVKTMSRNNESYNKQPSIWRTVWGLAVLNCGVLGLFVLEIMTAPTEPVHLTTVGTVQVERVGDTSITVREKNGELKRLFLNDATTTPDQGDKVVLTKTDTAEHGDVFGLKGYDDITTVRHSPSN